MTTLEGRLELLLKQLGLTELQSRCFAVILKSNGIKATQLAKELGISRPNTYTLLEKLEEQGLIYSENLVSAKVIFAQPYTKIKELIEKKRSTINETLMSFQSLKPLFNELKNSNGYLPKVRIYETKQALNTIVEDILMKSPNKEILLFTNQQSEKGFFNPKTHMVFIKTRVKRNISLRALTLKNREGIKLKKEDHLYLRETRFLPKEFRFHCEIYLYENKIAMIDSRGDVIGTIIESSELYQVQKQLFEIIWAMSK